MPWKSLRPTPNDGSVSKRYSTLFTTSDSSHSQQKSRPSLSRSPAARRQSDNGPRPILEESDHSTSTIAHLDHQGKHFNGTSETVPDTTTPSSLESSQPARRNRFSMLRIRHASDPQLSASYARSAPNSPAVPPLPPRKSSTWLLSFFQRSGDQTIHTM
jgi:hypothetical protein